MQELDVFLGAILIPSQLGLALFVVLVYLVEDS
jgi:hypothetical protein